MFVIYHNISELHGKLLTHDRSGLVCDINGDIYHQEKLFVLFAFFSHTWIRHG